MEIKKTVDEALTTIALSGSLDTNTAPLLEKELEDVVPNANAIDLDFAELNYLSSAGLRVILTLQKSLSAKGGKLVIRHVNDTIMDVFDMTGFSSILTIE